MHTWWNNDALLWDGLLSKASGTPLLVSETGIMQRHRLSGEAVRSPEEFAALLSRKIAYSFAAGAFGVIQWCYETNPFMNIDNEAAIGAKRVDGSAKPELAVLAAAAKFVARNKARFDGRVAPDVALVIPTSEHLSPRSLACRRNTRDGPRVLRSSRNPGACRRRASRRPRPRSPRVIVLPACRSISDDGWKAIAAAVEQGATLICSGWFETDEAGLPAERLGGGSRPLRMYEEVPAAGAARGAVFRFSGTIPESWPAADLAAPRRLSRGAGTIVHHPLPIEWADATPSLAEFYRSAMTGTKLAPLVDLEGVANGVLLVTVPFRDAWLLVVVNESSRARQVVARRPGDESARHIRRRGGLRPHGLDRSARLDTHRPVLTGTAYSIRNTVSGSTRVTRQAGTTQPRSATMPSTASNGRKGDRIAWADLEQQAGKHP